jgi:hypothetical protein
MRNKLIAVALITALLCMVVGNSVACTTVVVEYHLTINSTEGGSVTTPGEGRYTYCPQQGETVNLVATPDPGYWFVKWSGDVGTVADVNAAVTTITVNNDYSIKANFEAIPKHDLAISSTGGGSVTDPGEGTFAYIEGTAVRLVAEADEGYPFINWTGDVGTIADVNAAITTITMDDDYTIIANFEEIPQYELTVSSTCGGSVTTPGEGSYSYDEHDVVNLVAEADAGCCFVNWTGDVSTIADVDAATTTVTMNGDYSIKANFVRQDCD